MSKSYVTVAHCVIEAKRDVDRRKLARENAMSVSRGFREAADARSPRSPRYLPSKKLAMKMMRSSGDGGNEGIR
jgi:hypothetical protein